MIVVDMLRLAVAAERAHPALRLDHRVELGLGDPVASPEVVLARRTVPSNLAGLASLGMTGPAVAGESVVCRPVAPEVADATKCLA
jgi:hypothetical protein